MGVEFDMFADSISLAYAACLSVEHAGHNRLLRVHVTQKKAEQPLQGATATLPHAAQCDGPLRFGTVCSTHLMNAAMVLAKAGLAESRQSAGGV